MIPPVCRHILPCLAVAALLFVGCEDSDSKSKSSISWNSPTPTTTRPVATTPTGNRKTTTAASTPAAKGSSDAKGSDSPPAAEPSTPTVGDAVPYSSFHWDYGGTTKPRGARQSGVAISGLRFSKGGLSFSFQKDLSAWGLSYENPGALACLFVQDSKGRWVGGKFDWISSSRRSRDFENIFSGYCNWSLANVPNPCQAAFVITSSDGKRRSNVLVGTWTR